MEAPFHCDELNLVASPKPQPLRKSLHVLTLTPFYPQAKDDAGGCFVAEPLHWLNKIGVRNTVFAVRPIYRGRSVASRDAHPATWMHYLAAPRLAGLATSSRLLFLRIRPAIHRLHNAKPLSLIHAHAALPCGHAAALLSRELGIPFVVTVHGRDVFTSGSGGWAADRCKNVSKWVYERAAQVICVSETVQDELARQIGCRTTVVYNGVDTNLFSPGPALDPSNPVVLSVGNLIPSKGHDVLLRSIAQIAISHPTVRCHIIGTGPEQRRLMKLTLELGIAERVQFLGRHSRKSIADLLRRSTIFALPSFYEGLGCVYLEAMACGKPTIGCAGQGISEIIETGENGWLVAPKDWHSLSEILDRILSDGGLRSRLGTAARRTILHGFTLAHQAERLAHTYQGCVS